jgi:hypothetical protein
MLIFPWLNALTLTGNWIFFNCYCLLQCSFSASYVWSSLPQYFLLFSRWGQPFLPFAVEVNWNHIIWDPHTLFFKFSSFSIMTIHWLALFVCSLLIPLMSVVVLSVCERVHFNHHHYLQFKRLIYLAFGFLLTNYVMWWIIYFLHEEYHYWVILLKINH